MYKYNKYKTKYLGLQSGGSVENNVIKSEPYESVFTLPSSTLYTRVRDYVLTDYKKKAIDIIICSYYATIRYFEKHWFINEEARKEKHTYLKETNNIKNELQMTYVDYDFVDSEYNKTHGDYMISKFLNWFNILINFCKRFPYYKININRFNYYFVWYINYFMKKYFNDGTNKKYFNDDTNIGAKNQSITFTEDDEKIMNIIITNNFFIFLISINENSTVDEYKKYLDSIKVENKRRRNADLRNWALDRG